MKTPYRLRVLVAEDQPVNQRLMTKLLENLGHSWTIAAEGDEAVRLGRSGLFDAVLMDIEMPGMDGREATSLIRQQEQASGQHIPIIAVTSHASRDELERCHAAGCDTHLIKPIRKEDLQTVFDRIFAVSTQHEQARSSNGFPATSEIHSHPAFDRDAALKKLEDDEGFLQELVKMFQVRAPSQLDDLRNAARVGDWDRVRHVSHNLKGNLAALGAKAAQHACRVILEKLKAEDFSRISHLVAELEQAVVAFDMSFRQAYPCAESLPSSYGLAP